MRPPIRPASPQLPLPAVDSSAPSDAPQHWATVLVPEAAVSATLRYTWRDQGWGNQKGALHARTGPSADWVRLTPVCAPPP